MHRRAAQRLVPHNRAKNYTGGRSPDAFDYERAPSVSLYSIAQHAHYNTSAREKRVYG
jgi:hypothetical protein